MEKRGSRRLPPGNETRSAGALRNDGYKSSNYRAMDKRAGLRVGGHLPAGGNRRRLAYPRIPEPTSRSRSATEGTRSTRGETGRGPRAPTPDPRPSCKKGRHARWSADREAQGGPDQRWTSGKHWEHLLRRAAIPR